MINKKKNYKVVTGGAGFIGTCLIELLLKKEKNIFIISIDNYSSGSIDNHIKNKRIKYINGHTKNISKILKNINVTEVFHLGEFSRIVQSFKYVNRCMNSNTIGTFNVIEYCAKNNVKLIYSASSSKFGSKFNQHLSPYSWSKAKNIELIKNYQKWFKLNYVIVYFYNVYGPRQIKNNYMAAVISIFETQFLSNKPLTVVKPGNQKRDFTHVHDIVNGTYLASKTSTNSEYMLGTGKPYTILEVAKAFGSDIKMVNERAGERFTSKSVPKKAMKELGYKTKYDVIKYIKDFVKKNKK